MIIAAAGLAAHLAGAAASRSLLPVIGIPLAAGTLGLDALLSTVPMPPGVPVATVGVGEHREGQRAKVLEADAGIGAPAAAMSPWERLLCAILDPAMTQDFSEFIVQDPKICGGQPVIRGTRVTMRTVLASVAEGATVREILEDFPSLTEASVRAVIAFAAVSAVDDLPLNAIPAIR